MSELKTNKRNNTAFWWKLGIGLIGLFFLTIFDPPADRVNFSCDRNKQLCIIEKRALFSTTLQDLPISDIQYAHFDKGGSFTKGYHGPEIKLQDGNDISIGAGLGSTEPFSSSEQRETEKINYFLSNKALKNLSVTQTGFTSVVIAALLLIGGIMSLYKAIKPHIKID